jgi:hypothetical protein
MDPAKEFASVNDAGPANPSSQLSGLHPARAGFGSVGDDQRRIVSGNGSTMLI